MKEVKKWGFGAAPFKRDTEIRNRKALVLLRRFLQNEADNYETLPDGISCVEGLVQQNNPARSMGLVYYESVL